MPGPEPYINNIGYAEKLLATESPGANAGDVPVPAALLTILIANERRDM